MARVDELAAPPLRGEVPLGAYRATLRRLWSVAKRNKLGTLGFVLVILILAVAVLSPVIKRYDENHQFQRPNPEFNPNANPLDIARNPNLGSPFILDRWQAPNWEHWLGTDQYGRDIYARIVVGARMAVIIGFGASLISVLSGTITGLISGYFGGRVDFFLQRVVDGVQAFPPLVLLLLLVSVLEEPNLTLTVVALGFLGWAYSTRVMRSVVLSVSASTFVEAARAAGAGPLRIMFRHVLPNVFATMVVIFSISIGIYILAEAGLSFLGLGPADQTTWGKMVNTGRNQLDSHPWEALFSGLAITLAVLAFNLAGDALRDELDPRLRGRT
ncbi:Oligopeptide transport system permease protein OppC [bacterium HR24]|jgi:peptide/nickel transport system permease protein|nr:Oligopeptide transport system permease protein OppC [bacterium HR24]